MSGIRRRSRAVRTACLMALVGLLPQVAAAQFDPRGLAEREGYLCEPELLERRIAESTGPRREFLMAIEANAVDVDSGSGLCSGTFITPTCVLTAAHCMPNDNHRDMSVRHPVSGLTLTGGVGRQYPGWSHFNADEEVEYVHHETEGDTGLILFATPWPGFRPLTVWGFLGNRNFWLYDYDQGDGSDIPQAALNSYSWSDFGTLGTTSVAPLRVGDTRRARCTSSHFGWAPGPRFATVVGASDFTEGRIHSDADSGPGMSGGAVYDDRGILGTHTSGPTYYGGEEMEIIPGTAMRLLEREKKLPGFGGDFTILLPRQVRWVQSLCPAADIRRRYALEGPRVSDRAARGANGYIGAIDDAWARMSFSARQTHVSRAMERGDRGIFVRRLEAQLRRLGYLSRAPGDVFDETTETAVRRFQFERRLRETGKADIPTLQTLGILVK